MLLYFAIFQNNTSHSVTTFWQNKKFVPVEQFAALLTEYIH